MSDKEINIAILQELKRIANEIFTNEINIVPGTYTAAELAKEKSAKGDVLEIKYIPTNNESILTRSVCVGSFKCEFERRNIFNLIWKFEQLTGTKQKDKARFVRIEAGKVDLSFSMEITKEMQLLCKCVGNDPKSPVMSYMFIDYQKGYLVASNGRHLQACKANICNIVGETKTSVLINPKDFKQLSGVCSVIVSGGKITISDEAGRAYNVESSGLKYPRWALVVPKVSKNNYIKINEVKEVLSFLKKKEGTFYMYAEKGHKVTVDYTDSGSGAFSKIEVFTENEIPFAFSVMFDSKSFQTVAQKWDGGIFLNANYKAVVLTDKNKSLCFTMPAGTGKEGFFKMDFDFDRSNMVSLLEYGEKADAEPTTPKENIIVPVQIDPINLPVVASEYKYNAMGLYFLLSLLCDLCKAIIYHEAKEALKRLKMLLYSPAVNIEDFANEVQIIDLKPDEIEEIKEAHPITDISPGVTLPVPANVPAVSSIRPAPVSSVFFFPIVLRLVFRLWAISVSHYALMTPAKYAGCPRRGLIHIRGDTCRTTILTKRLFKLPMQISYKKYSL
jgi:hypothetical protein|nr:MAG TPA: DNA polymerase III subunit beta promoting factor, transferase.05A [Caudoviricetes sp.]